MCSLRNSTFLCVWKFSQNIRKKEGIKIYPALEKLTFWLAPIRICCSWVPSTKGCSAWWFPFGLGKWAWGPVPTPEAVVKGPPLKDGKHRQMCLLVIVGLHGWSVFLKQHAEATRKNLCELLQFKLLSVTLSPMEARWNLFRLEKQQAGADPPHWRQGQGRIPSEKCSVWEKEKPWEWWMLHLGERFCQVLEKSIWLLPAIWALSQSKFMLQRAKSRHYCVGSIGSALLSRSRHEEVTSRGMSPRIKERFKFTLLEKKKTKKSEGRS